MTAEHAGAAHLTPAQLLHGDGPPEQDPVELRAGAYEAALHGIELAYVRRGDREVLRRIHVTVRDENWDTVLPVVGSIDVEQHPQRATVAFSARNDSGAIAFAWNGRIELAADGTISYEMDGAAEHGFRYCRVGFCILHGADEYSGRPYRARLEGAGAGGGALPSEIAPQFFRDGIYLPVTPTFTSLEVDLAGDVAVRFELEGELFELEDQRNWTDASFKTYCTPAAKGYPFDAVPGQRFRQRVGVSVSGPPPAPRPSPAHVVTVELGEPLARRPPAIGIGIGGAPATLSANEARTLRELGAHHVRVELRTSALEAARSALGAASRAALAIDAEVEAAVFATTATAEPAAALLAAAAGDGTRFARVLVFDEHVEVTPAPLVAAVRSALHAAGVRVPIGAGTDLWFAEINRDPPGLAGVDLLSFSITPEVHAFDDASLVETLPVQAMVVESAASHAGGRPVAVSPVTLRPRNSAITIDSRQRSLFCAAWTVGSIGALAQAGAASITYYEAMGPQGVMESDAGSPAAGAYPALAGVVFPCYHVLAYACALAAGAPLACTSSDPARITAFAARTDAATHVAIANMRARRERVSVPLGRSRAGVRILDAASAADAMASPAAFRAAGDVQRLDGGTLELELGAHAVAFVESVGE